MSIYCYVQKSSGWLASGKNLRWVLLDIPQSWRLGLGLPPYGSPRCYSHDNDKRPKTANPSSQAYFKLLFLSASLTYHWPKQVLQSNINGVDKSQASSWKWQVHMAKCADTQRGKEKRTMKTPQRSSVYFLIWLEPISNPPNSSLLGGAHLSSHLSCPPKPLWWVKSIWWIIHPVDNGEIARGKKREKRKRETRKEKRTSLLESIARIIVTARNPRSRLLL